MKNIILTLGIVLLTMGNYSCSNSSDPSGASSSGSSQNYTSADIVADIYTNNSPGAFTGGIFKLDGGSPVTLFVPSAGRTEANIILYPKILNGTHTISYSDNYGTNLSCSVGLTGASSQVAALSICYSFSGLVCHSSAICGYNLYYSCP